MDEISYDDKSCPYSSSRLEKKDDLCHLFVREKRRYFTHHWLVFSFEKENLYVHFDIDIMTIQTNMKKEIKSKHNEQLAKAKAVNNKQKQKKKKNIEDFAFLLHRIDWS